VIGETPYEYLRGETLPWQDDLVLNSKQAEPTKMGSTSRLATLLLTVPALFLHAENRTKVSERDGLRYVWINPGSFMMGCADRSDVCFDWEPPPHLVEIRDGYWIGQTEVTQQAYERVTGKNPSVYRGPRQPVDQVGWNDARQYCDSVGMKLPTEAQWEFAARGGKVEWRSETLEDVAWYDINSEDRTHEVAQKKPNGYGLFDMLGNMWEWVEDSYGDTGKKILRGGSFYNLARDLRVSNRLWADPDTRHRDMGFRCSGLLP
jgi:formylglycine-generating enzyme required for sulfatase activity